MALAIHLCSRGLVLVYRKRQLMTSSISENPGVRRYIVSPLGSEECVDMDGRKQEDGQVAVGLEIAKVLGR